MTLNTEQSASNRLGESHIVAVQNRVAGRPKQHNSSNRSKVCSPPQGVNNPPVSVNIYFSQCTISHSHWAFFRVCCATVYCDY
jgi:hypothetical protein